MRFFSCKSATRQLCSAPDKLMLAYAKYARQTIFSSCIWRINKFLRFPPYLSIPFCHCLGMPDPNSVCGGGQGIYFDDDAFYHIPCRKGTNQTN